MLFSCFSCYQYVASQCVLWNFDLKSWVRLSKKSFVQFNMVPDEKPKKLAPVAKKVARSTCSKSNPG